MAFAAARLGDDEPIAVPEDALASAAESATRDVVDERVRTHLRRLQRDEMRD
jgi:hypothetical protein